MLESAITAGMCAAGAQVTLAGIMPTPSTSYLVRHFGYDGGVVISASHNPAEYNGIKLFNKEGYKLHDATEDEIEAVMGIIDTLPRPVGGGLGSKVSIADATDDYVEFLKSTSITNFYGMKAALDCANGASYIAAPKTFKELGAAVSVIFNEPNGININAGCGSTHIEALKKHVLEVKADAGFAFDGDADRCLAVDENGNEVDGDQIMAICAKYMKAKGKLKDNTLVATVMSNLGLSIMCRENGINLVQTQVGDRYVLEKMLAGGYNAGGEQSGHIIFLEHNTTGDGILTAVKLLGIMKDTGKPLSELAGEMQILPQVLVNAGVDNKKKDSYLDYDEIRAEIEKIEAKYAGEGRVLIRASGTEPLVRVMVEGKDEEDIKKTAGHLAGIIERIMN
jgi:phosphoglucosamine mutase